MFEVVENTTSPLLLNATLQIKFNEFRYHHWNQFVSLELSKIVISQVDRPACAYVLQNVKGAAIENHNTRD